MFWFKVIVEKILAGQTSASYEEIIDEMITDAEPKKKKIRGKAHKMVDALPTLC